MRSNGGETDKPVRCGTGKTEGAWSIHGYPQDGCLMRRNSVIVIPYSGDQTDHGPHPVKGLVEMRPPIKVGESQQYVYLVNWMRRASPARRSAKSSWGDRLFWWVEIAMGPS